MNKKEKINFILNTLNEKYPQDGTCFLDYNKDKPYELMIATIMSAQTTDKQVNIVTDKLFKKYDTVDKFCDCNIKDLEKDISSIGLYKNKAKSIQNAMILLRDEYNYVLPSDMDMLLKFQGVGRKTANCVRSHVFRIPSIVVDTHVTRISNRLGLVINNKDAVKIEMELMKILPKDSWLDFNQQLISFGREICKARSPLCEMCDLTEVCLYYKENCI